MGFLSHGRYHLIKMLALPVFLVLLRATVPWTGQPTYSVNRQGANPRAVAELRAPLQSPPAAQGPSGSAETPRQLEEKARWESGQTSRFPPDPQRGEGGVVLTRKQRQELLKSEFEKMKRDAAELVALAQSLQQEIEKSSENVLSMKIVEKANKIEGLAKRISRTARSY
jgi:uncharacterized iron-regulated membrane protein